MTVERQSREQILAEAAGRRLDEWVADLHPGLLPGYTSTTGYWVPPFSTDMTAAWDVAIDMRRGGWYLTLTDVIVTDEWIARFVSPDRADAIAHGDTAPHAICRAALLTVIPA